MPRRLASSPPRRSRTRPRSRRRGRPPRSRGARAGCRAARRPSSAPPPPHLAPAVARAPVRTGSTRCRSRARCSPRRRSSGGRRERPAAPGRAPTCPRAPGRAGRRSLAALHLRADAAVEDDAALRGEHLLEAGGTPRTAGRRASSLRRGALTRYCSRGAHEQRLRFEVGHLLELGEAGLDLGQRQAAAAARCRRPRSRTTRPPTRRPRRGEAPRR